MHDDTRTPPPTPPLSRHPSLLMTLKICRKKSDIKSIGGWAAYHDPGLPKRLPLGAEVRPRCARDAQVVVDRSGGKDGARRAREAFITKASRSAMAS